MDDVRPPLPLARHGPAWIRNEVRRWWIESSTHAIVLCSLFILFIGYFLSTFSLKLFSGICHYIIEYLRAALWDQVVQESCGAIKRELTPFWSLTFSEYMRLNRCLGNEAGFDRQGKLLQAPRDFVLYLLRPFGASLIPVLIIVICIYFVGPWGFRQIQDTLIYLITTPWTIALMTVSAPIILYIMGFFTTFAVVVFVIVAGSILLFAIELWPANDAAQGLRTAVENPAFSFVTSLYSYIAAQSISTWQALHDTPWMQHRECVHAPLCQCQERLDRTLAQAVHEQQNLASRNQQLRELLTESEFRVEGLQTTVRDLQVDRDNYKYMAELPPRSNTTRASGGFHPWGWGVAPTNPDLTAALDDARSRIGILLGEADNAKALRLRELAAHEASVNKLQAQINYSQGAGHDMSHVQGELENAKARVRTLDRGLKELTLTASALRMELAKERENHSEKCQNPAICQRQILELKVDCEKYRLYQLENDLLARASAQKLRGLTAKDVVHITIRSYLHEMTVKFLEFQAQGTPGLNTTNLQVELIRKDYAEQTAIKERLERELERLGGDVVAVRMGRDTTRPQDWRTETLTYEQNHYRVFPIYEELTQTVINLHDLLVAFFPNKVPAWQPEPARNDATQWPVGRPPESMQLLLQYSTTNASINPTALHEEALTEKLVVLECQRWYNRGVQLLATFVRCCQETSSQQLVTKEQAEYLEGISTGADRVLKRVLHAVLMAMVMLKRDKTERQPNAREKKRFEIYTAMQHSITALTNSIIENQKIVPRWSILLPAKSQPITRADDLATALVIQEMITLESRIIQLKRFMIDFQLPGTIHGPMQSQIQGDNGRYSKEYNTRVAAITFAELTMAHWMVWKAQKPEQVYGDNGIPLLNEKKEPVFRPRPSTDVQLLPLKWEDFMVAIKMKNAEVKEQDKDKWPEDQSPMLVIDPQLGPRIKFVPNSELKDQKSNNGKSVKDKADKGDKKGNENQNDTGSDADKQKARQEFETNRTRILQLSNHIQDWGIKGSIALPQIKQLAKNAALQTIKAQILTQNSELAMLSTIITSNNRQVPKWPKNGGPMKPK